MSKWIVRIIISVLLLLIVIYIGGQAITFIFAPYKTETAFESTVTDSISTKGIVFRNESIINKEKTGIVSYYYTKGEKVAKNSEIAMISNNQKDIENGYLVKQITKQIEVLEECKNASASTGGRNPETLLSKIRENNLSLLTALENRDLSDIDTIKGDIVTSLSRKQILLNGKNNLQKTIRKLEDRRNQLKSEITKKPKTIKTSQSGFFVDSIDGFESKATFKTLDKITLKKLDELGKFKSETESTVIGKVITSYEWAFAAPIKKADKIKFEPGKVVSIIFSSSSGEAVPATINDVIDGDDDNCILILKSSAMDEDVAMLRQEDVKITFKRTSGLDIRGLKVSKEALRIKDGEKGVYCLLSGEIAFKKVNITFETEDYFLSEINREDKRYLQLYDDVIVKGRNLDD